jgi:hypothetical protein
MHLVVTRLGELFKVSKICQGACLRGWGFYFIFEVQKMSEGHWKQQGVGGSDWDYFILF